MPFTPFHMGPALATKAVLGRHFSVPLYGVMQVAIDSEVLAGYAFRRDLRFQQDTAHVRGGDLRWPALTVLLLRPALWRGMRWWNRWVNAEPGSVWHTEPEPSLLVTVLSAFGGAWGSRSAGRSPRTRTWNRWRRLRGEIRLTAWSRNAR